jgi:hypothetical protein
VVPAMATALAAHGTIVRSTASLHTVDEAGRGLQDVIRRESRDFGARASGDPGPPVLVSSPESWRAWGLPDALLASLFRAAALYHAARPWKNLFNSETLNIATAGGARWTACALGNAGQQFGLALYADRAGPGYCGVMN